MVDCERRDLVCLHLDAHAEARAQSPVPRALTAAGIGDALELGDTTAGRIGLLDELGAMADDGLVEPAQRPVEGHDAPRTVYLPTDRGREHAAALRADLEDRTLEVDGDGAEAVPLGAVGRHYADDPAPLVTALVRMTDDGTVPLEHHDGEPFVDREEPLQTLRSTIEASFNRNSRTAVVAGPAGVGKTALVTEALDRVAADREDLVVARGDCPEGPNSSYEPMRRALGAVEDGDVLLEGLAAARDAAPPEDPDDVSARREALFEDVADRLRAAAEDAPVVVFLDNMQWADTASLALFGHLATAINTWIYPVAFVATYRPAALTTDSHPLAATLDRLADAEGYTEVALEGLDRAGTRTLLEGAVGSREVPAGFVDVVHDRTGGLPLFVRETAQHLLDAGAVDPDRDVYPTDPTAVTLPDAVTEGLEQRLAVLDDDALELVRLAAVVGEYVPTAVLAAASDLPDADRREYLDVLVAGGILEPAAAGSPGPDGRPGTAWATGSGGRDAVRFASGVLRETVVDRLPDDRAPAYHGRVADAVVAVTDDADDAAGRVAFHLDRAGRQADAVAHYRRAAEHAAETYANDVAVEQYRAALDVARDAPAVDDETTAATLCDLAAVHDSVGAYDDALASAEEGLALAPERSRARCRLLGITGGVHRRRGDWDRGRETAGRQRDLAADLGARDIEAEALNHLGEIARGRGEYDRAADLFERSHDIYRDVGDREGAANCLNKLGAVAFVRGEYDEVRQRCERSLAAARDLGAERLEADCLIYLGLVAWRERDLEEARDRLSASLAVKRDLRDRQGQANALNNLGLVAKQQGAYDEARGHLEECLALYRDLGDRHREALGLANLGMVAHARGDYGTAADRCEESLAIARELGTPRVEATALTNLGEVAASRADLDAAREHLLEALDIRRDLEDDTGVASTRTTLARVERAGGDLDAAATHLDEAAATYAAAGDDAGTAEVDLERARLARARDHPGRSREHAAAARETFGTLGRPHEAARARVALGRAAAVAGDRAAAREQYRAALETFADVGAPQDSLDVLERLVDACRAAGDEAAAESWRDRARAVLAAAPPATVEHHGAWVGADPTPARDG